MHIIYIGYYIEDSLFESVIVNKVKNLSDASRKFEYNLIRGIYGICGMNSSFFSYAPVDASIKDCGSYAYIDEICIRQFTVKKGNLNDIFKTWKSIIKEIEPIVKKHIGDCCVLMYAVNPIMIVPILWLKKKYNFNMCTICSEVPSLRRYGDSIGANLKKQILTFFNEKFDSYILFSEKMKDAIRIRDKPYMVVEGIASEIAFESQTNKRNIVMYAGGLAADNNIRILIRSIKMLPDLDELWICGSGRDEQFVIDSCKKDKRIKFFGRISNSKVLLLERQAKVLVNIRNPDVTLTKYSFPSKILEYLSSGTVVVSSVLEGIPCEYFDYIKRVDPVDEQNVARVIQSIFNTTEEEYSALCDKAYDFVKLNKTAFYQAKRIVDFCHRGIGDVSFK